MNTNKQILATCPFFIAAGTTAATFRAAESYVSLHADAETLKREGN